MNRVDGRLAVRVLATSRHLLATRLVDAGAAIGAPERGRGRRRGRCLRRGRCARGGRRGGGGRVFGGSRTCRGGFGARALRALLSGAFGGLLLTTAAGEPERGSEDGGEEGGDAEKMGAGHGVTFQYRDGAPKPSVECMVADRARSGSPSPPRTGVCAVHPPRPPGWLYSLSVTLSMALLGDLTGPARAATDDEAGHAEDRGAGQKGARVTASGIVADEAARAAGKPDPGHVDGAAARYLSGVEGLPARALARAVG